MDPFFNNCLLEKLKGRRKDLSQYDKFVNNYMASLTEQEKLQSPLANMALATQAWRVSQQKPLSQRILNNHAKQEEELMTLGLDLDYTTVEHVDLGLPSSLQNVFPQIPTCPLEKHLTSPNDKLDKVEPLVEAQTQEISNLCDQLVSVNECEMGNSMSLPTQNNEDILVQMFPQYSREGIHCALQSCHGNIYDTVDLLLKLLPEDKKNPDPPKPISFSQSASSAVQNIPMAPLNPLAVAWACPSKSGNRKANFCKKCGHRIPDAFVGSVCPNPSCCYPFQQKMRL